MGFKVTGKAVVASFSSILRMSLSTCISLCKCDWSAYWTGRFLSFPRFRGNVTDLTVGC